MLAAVNMFVDIFFVIDGWTNNNLYVEDLFSLALQSAICK